MKNILVVDNDKIFLMLMRRLLEKEGHQVETAGDGLNALDILKTYTPDVIFVDLVMPNIDGRTLCRIIRGMEKFKNTPIIILSATSAEELTDFSQLDVNACIAKGTFNETAQHVLSVFNQSNLASCRCLPGDVVGIKSVYPRGITKELLSVKRHFEIMLDRMSEGILEINLEGRIVYANSAAFSLIDIPQKDLLGLYFVDLFSGDDHQRISDLMKIEGAKSKTITEDAPVRLNRSQVTLNIIPLGEDESTFIIILHDVTERKKSEKALRESEERHRLLLEVSPDPIVLYDIEGRATYVNPAFEQTFGWSLAEIQGKRIDFVPEENWPETKEAIDRMLQGEKVKLFETRRLTKDGSILDIQLSASLFRDRDEKPAGNIVILRDITALKQAEGALQKAHDELEQRVEERTFELLRMNKQLEKEIEERKRAEQEIKVAREYTQSIIDSSLDMIISVDNERRIVEFNRAAEKTFGYSKEEVLGKKVDILYADPKEGERAHKTVRETGEFVDEIMIVRKNGRGFRCLLSATLLKDAAGNVIGNMGVSRDIEEKKQAEEALRKSEEKYRVLFETMAQGVVYQNAEGNIISANPAAERILGLSFDQMIGRTSMDPRWKSIHEDGSDFPGETHPAMVALKTGERVKDTIMGVFNPKEEDYRWTIINAVPQYREGATRPYQVYTTLDDITDLRRTERTLYFTQFAIDRSSDAAFWMGSDARFVYVNEAACRALGYSQDELLKMTVHDIDPDFPQEVWPGHWEDAKQRGSLVLESRHRTKDGRVFPVEISVNYLEFEGKEYNCAFARDISERKKKEETIQLGKREWESTFDAMSDWVSLIDLKYRILRSNRAGEKFVDLPTEETIGQNCCELLYGTQEPLPECPMQKMLQTHQRESLDLYVKEMNQWLRIVVDPVMDKDDNLVRAVHIVRDITELKKIEEERLKVMKLESIGIIAGGIAHDFNNLLSIIIGNIDLAKDDIKPEIGAFEKLSGAGNATLQAKELTKQLITFSKGGAPVKKVGSIGEFVMDTINLSILDSNIKCKFFIPHDLWLVGFDEGQMKHAINNMIVNTTESMPDGGTIDVTADNFIVTAERGLPLSDGKYVKISIQDRGVGIPEEHLSRIFDPYFTTKEMGVQKGMGLGLATTYSIINRHDGHITVESKVGGGTIFTLYLPAHEKDIRELEPEKTPRPEKPEIQTGRILLMDDEEMIRNLGKQMLSRFGYDAELAKDGAETIELYKKAMDSGKPFDAVILDLTVKGGMGGKDAVKNLSAIDPHVKAIVSSGYFNDPVMTDFRRYGFIGALPKPYTMKDLKDALDKVTKE